MYIDLDEIMKLLKTVPLQRLELQHGFNRTMLHKYKTGETPLSVVKYETLAKLQSLVNKMKEEGRWEGGR